MNSNEFKLDEFKQWLDSEIKKVENTIDKDEPQTFGKGRRYGKLKGLKQLKKN